MPETIKSLSKVSNCAADNPSEEQPSYQPVRVSVKIPQYLLRELDNFVRIAESGSRREAVEQLLCGRLEQLRVAQEQLEQESSTLEEARATFITEGGREAYVHRTDDHLSIEQLEEQIAIENWWQEKKLAATDDRLMFSCEEEFRGQVCSVSLSETRSKSHPTKNIRIRSYWQTPQGILSPIGALTLPRSCALWLADALQKADLAAQAEATDNRRRAQRERASRSPQEVAYEKEMRSLYIERYSKEKVNAAKILETRHRGRARKYNLTQHFTAWQWLDLCAESNFSCVCCGLKVNLEPHHKREMSQGGSNSIDNIEPLCHECHAAIYPIRQDRVQCHLLKQRHLLETFKIGDKVRRSSKARFGTIVELLPLEPNKNLAWPMIKLDANGNVHRNWLWWEDKLNKAQARVLWPGKGRGAPYEEAVDLEEITIVESAETAL